MPESSRLGRGSQGNTVADPECARGGGVSHILVEKGLLASLYSRKMHHRPFGQT